MNYKIITLTMISTLSLLTACDSNETALPTLLSDDNLVQVADTPNREELFKLEDGLYFAQDQVSSPDGWNNTVTILVKDGKINTVKYDAINQTVTNFKRQLSISNEYHMVDEPEESLKWHEQVELIETYLINHQSFDALTLDENGRTDAITGVTMPITPFIELVQKALNNGAIEKGPYQDGHYYAEQATFANGFKYNINLVVINGYISAAHWDAIDEEGQNLKEIETKTEEQLQWEEQANLLENFLISTQDPTTITFNEENQTDTIAGVTIKVDQFIELAIQALASGPTID